MERGMIVRLNSGGPNMIIKSINGEEITCTWPTKSGMEEMTISQVCVKKVCGNPDPWWN